LPVHDGYDKVAHLYDLFDDKDNVDFFGKWASEVDEILDIGAGTGRIAIPIARRGTSVWCVEPSAAMIREFRKKIERHEEIRNMITLIQADAASFSLDRAFPVAIMSGSYDHLLDDSERHGALSNIARHLLSGGRLVFDVGLGFMGDSALRPAGEKTVGDAVHKRFVGRKVLPDGTMKFDLAFETYRNGRLTDRIEQESFAATTDRETIRQALEKAGFRIERELRGYDLVPFRDGDGILVVEAVKARS
jgi:ubiquinone/menaquinone biosynthesis C-methylase UbiE